MTLWLSAKLCTCYIRCCPPYPSSGWHWYLHRQAFVGNTQMSTFERLNYLPSHFQLFTIVIRAIEAKVELHQRPAYLHLNPSGAGTFSRRQVTHCTEWESFPSFTLDSQGAVTYMLWLSRFEVVNDTHGNLLLESILQHTIRHLFHFRLICITATNLTPFIHFKLHNWQCVCKDQPARRLVLISAAENQSALAAPVF